MVFIKLLYNYFSGPFDEFNSLVRLTSGTVAPSKVELDLKNMYQKGIYLFPRVSHGLYWLKCWAVYVILRHIMLVILYFVKVVQYKKLRFIPFWKI